MSTNQPSPLQPIIMDEHGAVRFRANALVRYMLDWTTEHGGPSLNELASMDFTQDDRCQFAQLIGYSICGYHELPYVSDEHAAEATAAARLLFPHAGGCRDDGGCRIHSGVQREDTP